MSNSSAAPDSHAPHRLSIAVVGQATSLFLTISFLFCVLLAIVTPYSDHVVQDTPRSRAAYLDQYTARGCRDTDLRVVFRARLCATLQLGGKPPRALSTYLFREIGISWSPGRSVSQDGGRGKPTHTTHTGVALGSNSAGDSPRR